MNGTREHMSIGRIVCE